MEKEFEFKGRRFVCSKIPVLKQWQIVRRMLPVFGDLVPALGKLSKKKVEEMTEEDMENMGPVIASFAKLSEKDSNQLLIDLLSSVEIHQEEHGNWARLANGESIKFDDLGLPVLLVAAGRAFMFNLSGFLDVLPQASHGSKGKQRAQ